MRPFDFYGLKDNIPLEKTDYSHFAQLSCVLDTMIKCREKSPFQSFANGTSKDEFGISWSQKLEQHPNALKLRSGDTEYFERFRWITWGYSGNLILPYQVPDSIPKPDYYLLRFLQISGAMPNKWTISLPVTMGEVGHNFNGICVNQDSVTYQERLNLLALSGVLAWLESKTEGVTILEIGSGFGALALHLIRGFNRIRYYICDLPMGLFHSACYLSKTLPNFKHTFYLPGDELPSDSFNEIVYVPNYLIEKFRSKLNVDLVINTLSMSEMNVPQVKHYAELIRSWIGSTGLFFDQNMDNRHIPKGINAKTILASYFKHRSRVGAGLPLTCGTSDLWNDNQPPERLLHHFRDITLRRNIEQSMQPLGFRSEPDYFHPQVQSMVLKYGCDAPQFSDPKQSLYVHPESRTPKFIHKTKRLWTALRH